MIISFWDTVIFGYFKRVLQYQLNLVCFALYLEGGTALVFACHGFRL